MRVLLYLDASPRAEWALAAAAQLPPSWRSQVLLLATEEDVAAEPELLARAGARLAGSALTETVRPGPAERAVVACAREGGFDLLVVPPAGRGAVARMLRGSRVATVVRAVRAPVLIARRPPVRFERSLAALSGAGSTEAVLHAARRWETEAGVRAAFVHVSSAVALPRPRPDADGSDLDEHAVHQALDRYDLRSRLVSREGLVVDEVLDVFESGAHHLLLIGAHAGEEPGFGREDLTERLLLRCPGCVLIVPPPPAP